MENKKLFVKSRSKNSPETNITKGKWYEVVKVKYTDEVGSEVGITIIDDLGKRDLYDAIHFKKIYVKSSNFLDTVDN